MKKLFPAFMIAAAMFCCTVSQAQTTPVQQPPQDQMQPQAQAPDPQAQNLPPALPQTQDQTQAATQQPPAPQPAGQMQPSGQPVAAPVVIADAQSSLTDRFGQCLSNKDCTTQTRLQIIQEENDDMLGHFQKIHQACADANFQNCMDIRKDDVQAWYSAQHNMQQMMKSLGTQDLSAKEPAAGDAPVTLESCQKRTFWEKFKDLWK